MTYGHDTVERTRIGISSDHRYFTPLTDSRAETVRASFDHHRTRLSRCNAGTEAYCTLTRIEQARVVLEGILPIAPAAPCATVRVYQRGASRGAETPQRLRVRMLVADLPCKEGNRMMAKKATVTLGSGNVFRDLGLKNPEELLAKSQLAARIVQILEKRKVTQTQAAKLLGIDQPKVSQIYRGRLDDFSVERLMRLITTLHRDIRIIVEEKPRRGRGRVIVEAA